VDADCRMDGTSGSFAVLDLVLLSLVPYFDTATVVSVDFAVLYVTYLEVK